MDVKFSIDPVPHVFETLKRLVEGMDKLRTDVTLEVVREGSEGGVSMRFIAPDGILIPKVAMPDPFFEPTAFWLWLREEFPVR